MGGGSEANTGRGEVGGWWWVGRGGQAGGLGRRVGHNRGMFELALEAARWGPGRGSTGWDW